jgi:hypothetical protein
MNPISRADESKQEANAATRRLCHAFRQVFGRKGDPNLTPQQAAVWAYLEEISFQNRSTFPQTAGPKDDLSFAVNEGYRCFFLQIRELVTKDFDEPAQPPTVRR